MASAAQAQGKSWFWIAVVLMMLIPGVLSLLYLRSAPRKPIDSLAVVPFRNLSGDAEGQSLSDGITERLTRSLAQLPDLVVVSRDAALPYKDSNADAKTIGHALGARAVVKGTVERQGDHLLVSAELLDSGDNSVVWSEQYSVNTAEAATLQDAVAKEIHERIRFH
jgi:TolB-like protein